MLNRSKVGKSVPNGKVPKKTRRKIRKREKRKWRRKMRNLTRAKEDVKTAKATDDIKSCKVKEDVKASKVKEAVKSANRGVKPLVLGENFSPHQEALHQTLTGYLVQTITGYLAKTLSGYPVQAITGYLAKNPDPQDSKDNQVKETDFTIENVLETESDNLQIIKEI